jgi:predicted dithiol-disulfide oxidoreductase (DUF899 family)
VTAQLTDHKIGTREEWLAAREQLLVREKEYTRFGDELARQRPELPWVRVEKEYRFDTDDGEKPLVELFDGRSQLLVYHFMSGPSYEAGCPVNSSIADTVDGVRPHLPLVTRRSCSSHKHRSRNCRPTFLMGYYPILDHAPKGRDEDEAWQLWIRRHDEYDNA